MTRFLVHFFVSCGLLALAGCEPGAPPPVCSGDPGTTGCACRSDGTCDDGLVCVENVCAVESASGLVLPAGARGCDVLLAEGTGTRIAGLRFADTTRGTFVREAPRVAVSVVSASDADFAGGAVQVVFTGDAPTVHSARCVDSAGSAIASTNVVLQ